MRRIKAVPRRPQVTGFLLLIWCYWFLWDQLLSSSVGPEDGWTCGKEGYRLVMWGTEVANMWNTNNQVCFFNHTLPHTHFLFWRCYIRVNPVNLAGRAILSNKKDESSPTAIRSSVTSVAIYCLSTVLCFLQTHTDVRSGGGGGGSLFFHMNACLVLQDNPFEHGGGGLHGCWAQSHSQESGQSGG